MRTLRELCRLFVSDLQISKSSPTQDKYVNRKTHELIYLPVLLYESEYLRISQIHLTVTRFQKEFPPKILTTANLVYF